jgi:hypothetical protein
LKSTLHIELGEGTDPFLAAASRPRKEKFREFINRVQTLIGAGLISRSIYPPTAIAGTAQAVGTATAAAVQTGDTVTLNGQALTATQHHARGTATLTSVIATDVLEVNGVDFTAVAADPDPAANEFLVGVDDTATAVNLAAAINASTDEDIADVVTATSATTVVTIRAVEAGTGGNAITLSTPDGTIAVSAATLAGGAAVALNEFDFGGTNAQTASALALAINSSTTGVIDDVLRASNFAGTIALSSVAAGEWVKLGEYKFTAISGGTAGRGQFSIAGTDTEDATALAAAINATPGLKDQVLATSSSATVTVRQRPPAPATALPLTKSGAGITLSGAALAETAVVHISAVTKGKQGNANTLASSNGSRLAVSGARLTGGTQEAFTF